MYCAPAELKHDLNEYKELHYGNSITKIGKHCRCPYACDHRVILDLAKIYTSVIGFTIVSIFVWAPLSKLIKGPPSPQLVSSSNAENPENQNSTSGGVLKSCSGAPQTERSMRRSKNFSSGNGRVLSANEYYRRPTPMFYTGVSGPVRTERVAPGGAYAYGDASDIADLTCVPSQFGKPRTEYQ